MIGDERTRHCGSCRREVFNLAALTPDEAERFSKSGLGKICVFGYRRRDRTVLVGGDCRTGAARRTAAIAASGLTLVVAGLALFAVRGSARVECDGATGSDVTRAGVVSRGVTGAVCEPPVRPTAPIELMGALWVEDIEESVGLPQLGEPLTQPDRPTGLYVEGAPRLPVARPHRNARASDDRGGTGGRWVVWLDSQSRDRSSVRRTSHLEPARHAQGCVFPSQRVEVARRRRVVLAHIAQTTLASSRGADRSTSRAPGPAVAPRR